MLRHSGCVVFACALGLFASPSLGFRSGPPAGANGSTASFGASCQGCHGATAGGGSVQILGAPTTYTPNTIYNISVRVADPAQLGAGFQLSVEDAAGIHRGTLILTAPTLTQHNGGWVNHTSSGVNNAVANWGASGNSATYNMQWQAPATDLGALTFWAAGNAINNNFSSSGDIIYLTSVSATFSGGTGACCNDSTGVCQEGLTQGDCEGGGGRFGGVDSTCLTIDPPCVAPTGACCDDGTGVCTDDLTQAECEGGGDRYGGDDSTCGNIDPPCVPPPTGACCDDTRGVCSESVSQAECEDNGMRYGGDGSTCGTLDPPCEAPVSISLKPFVSGLPSPVDLTHAGDGSGRIFIVDQGGKIHISDAGGSLLPDPFLDVSSKLPALNAGFDERGLLGLAFHPNYTSNGRFFIRYSAPRTGVSGEPCFGTSRGCHSEVLAEYNVVGDPATSNTGDPNSEVILFTVDEPQFNHNGGQVAFGPDGYLYWTLGDGGGAHDGLADVPPSHGPIGNGQNRFTPLGKIHRIDVDSPPDPGLPYAIPSSNPFADGVDGLPEIYAYGLRNPYKFSFDDGPSGDGTMWLSDVGQALYEEVNIGVLGANYGWVIREGNHCFDPFNPATPPASCATTGDLGEPLVDPVMEYLHRVPCTTDADCAALGVGCDEAAGQCENEGGISIIGGFVYRGSAVPELAGRYVFGDFSAAFGSPGGRLYYMDTTGPDAYQRRQFFISPNNPSLGRFLKGFGEDEDGELYALVSTQLGPFGAGGSVLRIAAPFPTAPTADPSGIDKSRFISFQAPEPTLAGGSVETALRINMTSLHHVSPPYNIGVSTPFTAFEGQSVWVGPPATYPEASASSLTFNASIFSCVPHYRDWSTEGLLHVTGSAIVPSSVYHVESVAAACAGVEDSAPACQSGGENVSSQLEIRTTRWADLQAEFNPPSATTQPDLGDIAALVAKFRSAPGAPIKARALLSGYDAFGAFSTALLEGDLNFSHIAACVAAFRGNGYPFQMGRCATFSGSGGACTTDADCTGNSAPPCLLYCY